MQTSSPWRDETTARLAEGGTLTLATSPVRHLHVELDDPTRLFGLAVGIDPSLGEDGGHVLEHLVMRSRVGSLDLISCLERQCTTRWWHGFTTACCISFEVASLTNECMGRSARALSQALFRLDVQPGDIENESHPSNGRITAEESGRAGTLRHDLLRCAAQALWGGEPGHERSSGTLDALSWHRQNVRPDRVLWFTYGALDLRSASELVVSAAQAASRAESSRVSS